jgi:hypothetical protein
MSRDRMDDVMALWELKARYCRLVDTKDWDAFRSCLAENFSAEFVGMPRSERTLPTSASLQDRDRIIDAQAAALAGVVTIHQVFSPEIRIEEADTASGIWGMRDHVIMPKCVFTGYGHYHEKYHRINGEWVIQQMKVTRLHVVEVWKD